MSDLISRLLDSKLEAIEEGPQISRALNMIVLKVLENSDRNAVFHVLINILTESYAGLYGYVIFFYFGGKEAYVDV